MTLTTGRGVRPGWRKLSRHLLESGAMAPDWAPAFEAVDRARFLPSVMWPYDMATRTSSHVDRDADPDAWYAAADADVPVTTQWDDGRHLGTAPGTVPTSSASMPSVVMAMLDDLDVRDGMTVLEIGTGTGWNAGLLTHRLGDRQVTTVEVDATVAAQADSALHRASLHPITAVADGLNGHPADAPYDRLIATVGLRTIPQAWLRQVTPGGVIVAPWGRHYANSDVVARLVVADDGSSASGKFTRPVEFMKARSQRVARSPHAEYVPDGLTGAATSTTTLTALEAGFEDPLRHPFTLVAGLLVGDCVQASDRRGDERSVWLYGLSDRSWAAVLFHDGQPVSTVYQGGPRQLWEEIEAAYRWWEAEGRPGIERFGLTVSQQGDQTWLDTPERPVGE
ncbi:methyltransferase domain-containing protein [Streptomyces sp. NPDC002659]|uniref:methyltransferase domain-containing protein n=1 Tax=Streptomyces sp. NPDC002659 TaxID=3364656 RepID=UPI0036AEEDBC